ncbi:MAG: ATP-binding protein [Kofleriaceae bacterium]|nr:ATP-binding protein [Kofleriaceae bacterium]
MTPRRAWIYVLSVVALLGPAAGIAYLGAVSYRDERGAIAAQDERQRRAAVAIAERVERSIEQGLAAAETAARTPGADRAPVAARAPGAEPTATLARYWFWIDADRHLRIPRPAPPPTELGATIERGAPCSAGLRLDDCVREQSSRPTRVAKLRAAQRAEGCRGDACAGPLAEAKRAYTALAAYDDTGPEAKLGLARVLLRAKDPRATQVLAELEKRFAERTFEGVPVRLVAGLLRAEAPEAKLAIADDVLHDRYPLEQVIKIGLLQRIRALLAGDLASHLAVRRAALDDAIAALQWEARAAAGLADDVEEMARTATPAWRGITASRNKDRTLIFRRLGDGSVVGISVDAPMLEDAAGNDPQDLVAINAGIQVLPAGASPGPGLRSIATVPIGDSLPHLALSIVNPVIDPDPRDEVVRVRSRRHVMYTSALAIALGLGLLLIIRGAARARELAQLKSDFVSTVSHELKTPLTSIRMFAEMLEQGVAKGDLAKMARYHGVIVQESQRLGLLIANLLDYAQIEKGTRRYAPSRHDVGQLAQVAVSTFETLRNPDTQKSSIEVEVAPEATRVEVEVDRDVVVQALLNLLANAAKYGGAERPIEVSVGADATTGWISVRDHGPGIPPAEQARIFREFYRAPEAYRSGVEGTGLGLALVKRHIEALGGTVDVASTVGEGACFTIRVPRVPEAAA